MKFKRNYNAITKFPKNFMTRIGWSFKFNAGQKIHFQTVWELDGPDLIGAELIVIIDSIIDLNSLNLNKTQK